MSDIRGCFVCAETERTDKGLDECYACQSCVTAHIRHYKPQLQHVVLNRAWKCTICGDEKAQGVTVEKFLICKDRLACKDRSRDRIPGPKLAFLQQFDPSPLSSDFQGDVSIVINDSDECIQAHRFIILAGRSPVFKSMMEIDMKEKLSGVVQIGGMSAATVRAAVKFMYTGDIEFSHEVCVEEILKFADQYEVQLLKDVCEDQLVNFSSEKLWEMISISYRFRAEKLKEVTMKYFSDHPEVHNSILSSFFTGL